MKIEKGKLKMNLSSRGLSLAILIAFVSLCQPVEAQEAQQRLLQRAWTCHATVFLAGTTYQYTPSSWTMRTGGDYVVWGDREKSCKKYIKAKILTKSIWNQLGLPAAEFDKVCNAGSAKLRVEYGFDKRPKSWSFIHELSVPWTGWLNRDNPGGNGDFETLADFVRNGQVCANPRKIQCRGVGTRQLVSSGTVNGQNYRCDVTVGGVCDNRQQNPGVRCGDYEVRFLCL